ncbi:hypothetical protein M9Y10_028420 [Tritrichomonas musculus]|uniref:Uncharacterized protein n=1 Tax=Tritrichomonas musculus TaxID=1915356 RepID=A0ABR2KK86_9EUKA
MTQRTKIPKCKLRGDKPSELYLSTSKPQKTPQQQPKLPPSQVPPQAEALATEYAHNLQQQLYFLDAELKFLQDRSTIDGPEGPSVDASIRRLRNASCLKEEETNKEIQEKQDLIADYKNKIDKIKEEKGHELLQSANERESEGLEALENAFVEVASELKTKEYQSNYSNQANEFIQNLETSMKDFLENQKNTLDTESRDFDEVNSRIDELRQQRKQILNAFNTSIKNKSLQDEEIDVINIIVSEPDKPPPNVPLSTINAKNAKLEMQLKATLSSRGEIEQQVDLLLEKNIELKATLNQVNATLARAKWMKEEMEKAYLERYEATKKLYDEKLAEIAALKRMRKEMKAEIFNLTKQINKGTAIKNQKNSEEQMNRELIDFNNQVRSKIDEENEQTKREINAVNERISQMREQLDSLAIQITEAGEQFKQFDVQMKINEENPMCQPQEIPPELQVLFESLTAVKEAIA